MYPRMPPHIHTLRQGNKTVSINHRRKHYLLGFQTAITARKVHYSMHPEPKFTLIRENDIDLSKDLEEVDIKLTIDTSATLFIPKCKGSIHDPMNDGGYHLDRVLESDFLLYPVTKNLGIVVPYVLECEDENEFMFKAYVIDPQTNHET